MRSIPYFGNNRGRTFGELPETALSERGESYPLDVPIGIPPMANATAPGANPGSTLAVGDKQSNWQFIPFTIGTTPVKIQDFMLRKFLLIQNRDGANTIYLGFGWIPNVGNGIVLAPGVAYEPYSYPINEIYAVASAANTSGLLVFGN